MGSEVANTLPSVRMITRAMLQTAPAAPSVVGGVAHIAIPSKAPPSWAKGVRVQKQDVFAWRRSRWPDNAQSIQAAFAVDTAAAAGLAGGRQLLPHV